MHHTRINDNGTAALDQVAHIVLTCAFIIGRQKAATEVSFTAFLAEGFERREIKAELDIFPSSELGSILQSIEDILQVSTAPSLESDKSNDIQGAEEEPVITITRHDGYWDLATDLQDSHKGDFSDTFGHIHSQIESNPENGTISQLQCIRQNDVQWLLDGSHDIPPPLTTTAVEMFNHVVEQDPEKIAVEAWDGDWTYNELDEQSTQLAAILIQEGVQPGTVVPLFFRFSKWVPVSLVAVWKAGAAWVFLDADHPLPRLQTLVKRVGASVIVTQADLQAQLRVLKLHKVLADETHSSKYLSGPDQNANLALPQNPSYLIFTSGSTGEPKAVVSTHTALCSGVLHQGQYLGFSSKTRTLENCPLIFAGAIAELLYTLLAGGCMCIPRQEERIEDLAGCATRFRSNLIILASSSAAVRDPKAFPSGHRVLIGAEPLSGYIANRWGSLHDCCNAYGSSETNVITTCCSFTDATTHKSVGKGAAHRYWIVDASNHEALVPPGWLGEIVVESHALASGYMDNEEATAKAFPSVPTWRSAFDVRYPNHGRFYRTGDLGRMTSDAQLEVHGRTDALQVKLRGQRVELGEIEAACLGGLSGSVPLVAELILPKGQERPSIAVFLVATNLVHDLSLSLLAEHVSLSSEQQRRLDLLKEQLRSSWAASLPEYMAPNYIVPLAELPRTATGKINRLQLRSWASEYRTIELMGFAISTSSKGLNRPLTGHVELRLANAVTKVLGLTSESINAGSVFTVLGGDSLAAIQLSHKLSLHNFRIAPSEIIQSENLASLATQLTASDATEDFPESISNAEQDEINKIVNRDFLLQDLDVASDNISDVLFTTDSQSRSIELGTGVENCFIFHMVLKFPEGVELARLKSALQRLVDRHDSLRTLFTQKENRILQVVFKHLSCPLQLQDLDEEGSVDEAVDEISQSKIRIDQVPTQFWILSKNESPAALVMRLSHAQFDGISMHLLWNSLAECYIQTGPAPAPAYSDYARTVLHKDNNVDVTYFKELLQDVPFTDLVKRPKSGHLPQNRSLHRTLTLQPVPGFTMAHLFEAAWGYVCARFSSTHASVFDTIVSGRQVRLPAGFDVSKLVGACLNDVPVVVRFPKGQSVQELLTQVRDQHNASAKHETLGFRTILGDCKPADWPKDARMTSSVQYRGFEGENKLRIGDHECTFSILERSMDLEDLTVVVTPQKTQGSVEFEVEFLYSDKVVEESQAGKWFDKLIQCVAALSREGSSQRSVDEVLGLLDS